MRTHHLMIASLHCQLSKGLRQVDLQDFLSKCLMQVVLTTGSIDEADRFAGEITVNIEEIVWKLIRITI